MSALITALVAGLVIFYLRTNHKARGRWLQNLALPGQWRSQRDDSQLVLSGSLNRGDFQWRGRFNRDSGLWKYAGQTLTLKGDQTQTFEVQMFQPGVISLIREDGTAELFHKQATNVVPLAKK